MSGAPRISRIERVVVSVWLLAWALQIAVALEDYARSGRTAYWQPVLWESSSSVVLACLLLVQLHTTRQQDHLVTTPRRWFALQFMWVPLHCICFVPLAFGIRHAVYALAGAVYTHEAWPNVFGYESMKLTLFFSTVYVVRFGILSFKVLLEEKLRAEQSNALLRQAQLLRLAQQMQPHFLFNALNTVSSLMHSDVEKADTTLIQLADVLRTTLEFGEQHEAPLATELQLARGYAHLMAARFEERVHIDWQIDEDALACKLPVMSVQPLLENIFKHTVERQRQPTRIVICARREAQALVLRLSDDRGLLAPGAAPPGIGLANLRARLDQLYGDGASVHLSQLAPAGVLAELRLPCAC
jgi:two-component system, LytTR family, sensor kinase